MYNVCTQDIIRIAGEKIFQSVKRRSDKKAWGGQFERTIPTDLHYPKAETQKSV